MHLYDMVKAPNPRRVRIFLAEKKIEIPTTQVDIPSGENLQPAYLAINPRGVVPTLTLDDGTILDESVAICRYFEALYPNPNLFGRSALEQAQVERWQRRLEFEGLFHIAMIFRNTASAFAGRSLPGQGPSLPQEPSLVTRAQAMLPPFFQAVNAHLSNSRYMVGDHFSIADITALVMFDFARWIKMPIPTEHSATLRWYAEVSARPSAKA
jgi:glutathione S-transferase